MSRQQAVRRFQDGCREAHQQRQLLRYGIGVAVGMAVAHWADRTVRRIPIIGRALSPFLSLVPTKLIGGCVGAAVVYGIDEGDVMAARKKLLPRAVNRVKRAKHELTSIVDELQQEVRSAHRQNERAARQLLPALEATVDDMGRQLSPVLERGYAQGKRHLEQAFPELQLPEPTGRRY